MAHFPAPHRLLPRSAPVAHPLTDSQTPPLPRCPALVLALHQPPPGTPRLSPRPWFHPPPACRPRPLLRSSGSRCGGNGQGGASGAAPAKAGTLLLPAPAGSSHSGSRRHRGGSGGGGGGGGRERTAVRGADPAVLRARRAARERCPRPGAARTLSHALRGEAHAALGAAVGAAADFG